jgi:hypothetical protein
MDENVEFMSDLAKVVQKHYPDGKMRADDVTTYFGMVIAAALENHPEAVRDRAARVLAQFIKHPQPGLWRGLTDG